MNRGKLAVLLVGAFLVGVFLGRFDLRAGVPAVPGGEMAKRLRQQEEVVDAELCKLLVWKAVVAERLRLTGKVNPEPRGEQWMK
jgi:hypothetical protein